MSASPDTNGLTADKLPADKASSDKLLGLEGLRFVATLGVLLHHYQHFAFVAGSPVGLIKSKLPFYALLSPFYEAGEYGVWIFWCISGFIFFWKYRETISGRTIDGWTFFVFRVSRLYPLHVATLIIVASLQPLYFAQHGFFFVYQNNDMPHLIAQLGLASDWLPTRSESFNGPIWSVSVEVLVYAAFFLALRFVTASPLFSVLVVLVSLNIGTQLSTCLVFFYAGGLAAMARQAANAWTRPMINAGAWCAAVAIPIIIAVMSPWVAFVDGTIVLACVPLLLFCCAGRIALPSSLEAVLEGAGNMTYSCYLLHFPIQLGIALGFTLAHRPIPYQSYLFWAAYIIPTLLASRLVYRYFELPAQRLIRRTLLQRPEAVRTSQAAL